MSDPPVDELDALLARLATHTDALRRARGDADDQLVRAMLADLARVASMLRADATLIGQSLASVLEPRAGEASEAGDEP